jgi:hypothetical protein
MYTPYTLITVVLIVVMFVAISKNMFVAALLILFGPTLIVYISLQVYEKAFVKYRNPGAREEE